MNESVSTAVARLSFAANILAVAVLTTVLIAVQQG